MRCLKSKGCPSFFFVMTSFFALSLGSEALVFADEIAYVTVADDGGVQNPLVPGTLSYEIATTGYDIQIEISANPVEMTGNIKQITNTRTISSDVTGESRTINGNIVNGTLYGGVYVNEGTATFSSDIILSNLPYLSVGPEGQLVVNGPVVNLGGGVYNQISYQQGSMMDISGDISGSSGTTLSLCNGITTLSGTNTSYAGSITIGCIQYAGRGRLEVSSINNIGTGYVELQGGTLHSIGDVIFAVDQEVGLSYSSNFITDTGCTLTIPILKVNAQASTVALTLEGPGVNVIEEILFVPQVVSGAYQDVQLNIIGVLGGTGGFSLVNSYTGSKTVLTVVHSSVNTYTGATSVGIGCGLQVNSGASFGTSSDTVTVAQGAFLTNSGSITASTFTNNGMTTLNTDSTVTCTTFANNGILSGCGSVTGTYVGRGTTSTGCSPSPLTITGDATFTLGSVLSPYLDTSGVAGLNVSGDLTLDSGVTLTFRPEPGCYTNGAQHQFLSVGGTFAGTFSTVNMGTILLIPNITYGSNGATLTIERAPLGTLVHGNNAKKVGQALEVLIEEEIGSGDLTFCELIGGLLLLSQEGLSSVLNQLQPALFKGLAISQESSMIRVQESLNNRMQTVLSEKHCRALSKKTKECSQDKKPFHVWAAGIGNALHQGSANYAGSPQVGYHENMGGAVAAVDAFFAKCLYAGILGAYTSTDVKWTGGQGHGNIQSGYAGTYFSAIGDMFYGNASVIGSLNTYHAERKIFLPASQFTAKNNHGGPQLLSHLDTGVNLGWGWFSLKPFDSFDYIAQKERGFTETGAGNMDLSVKKSNAILIRNELGLNFSGCFCAGGARWVVSPKISWVREVRVKGSTYTANFVDKEESFTVTGFFPDRSLVSPGVNVTGTMLEDRLTLTAYYNGEIRGSYNNHSYGGEVRFGF